MDCTTSYRRSGGSPCQCLVHFTQRGNTRQGARTASSAIAPFNGAAQALPKELVRTGTIPTGISGETRRSFNRPTRQLVVIRRGRDQVPARSGAGVIRRGRDRTLPPYLTVTSIGIVCSIGPLVRTAKWSVPTKPGAGR